ncbi:MAG: LysM peptidoglycan-binding domain-containing protein [Deltaproteobacteria bacterium]|nr:LysM peptidoglycan-binding domain-containing protein [Deltaproteobacteria bacterium]
MKLKSVLLYAFLVAFLAVYSTGCQTPPPPVEEPVVETPPPAEEEVVEAPVVEEYVEPPMPVEEPEAPVVESYDKTAHVVVKGENLWTISEYGDVYSDPFQWPVIYKANRNQIKDPDLIYPNQEFEIPRDVSQEEIDDAVHEAKTRGPWSLWDGK